MKKMTETAAARIQSAEALKNDGMVNKDSFAARAQRVTAQNNNSRPAPNNGPSTTGQPSGSGRGNNPPRKK